MPYCTVADILAMMPENDLIQLTDDAAQPYMVNQANVDRAISDAGELIDSSLRGRYTLPLSPVPGIINTLATDVAIYRLYARRVKLTPPPGVSERYTNAQKILDQIQSGKKSIGGENTGGVVTPEIGGPQFTASERTFTKDSLADY